MYEEKSIEKISLQPLFVFVIVMIMILIQMTADQYIPSLPAITKTFQSSEASIQLTVSLFAFGLGLSHLFYGPLSDRIGRKPPLMMGIGLSIFGSLICFIAPSVWVLILGRFIQGFGIGCCNSVGRSLVRDLFTDRVLSKIASYLGIVSVFIIVAAPILGGYIQEHFGWRMNFLFIFFLGITIWFLIFATLTETNKNFNPNATQFPVMRTNYLILLKSKFFLGYTFCACFACAGLVAYITIAPFLFQDTFGLTPLQFGQLSIFIAGAICITGLVNSQMVMKKGVLFMVFTGAFFMVVGGFCMLSFVLLGVNNVMALMIPVTLFSVGVGFTYMNAFAGAFHPFPQMAGTVGALYACMQDLSAAVISGIIAIGHFNGQFSLAIIFVMLGLGSWVVWYFLISEEA